MSKGLMIVTDYGERTFTPEELCEICHISRQQLHDLLEYEIIRPINLYQPWEFDLSQLIKVKTAMRLSRDLEVDFAIVAILLDLKEELEEYRTRLALFEKHYLR